MGPRPDPVHGLRDDDDALGHSRCGVPSARRPENGNGETHRVPRPVRADVLLRQLRAQRTTFILPAEVFATKFSSTLHGVSAATGKLGAVVGAFGFGALQLQFGTRVTLVALAIVNFVGMLFTALVPETKRMHLDDAACKSTSTYGRRVQKDAACPLYEAESRGAASAAAK